MNDRVASLVPRHENHAGLLEWIGQILHGEHWVTPLAADLNLSRRTVQRMANGSQPVYPDIWGRLLPLVTERKTEANEAELVLRMLSADRPDPRP